MTKYFYYCSEVAPAEPSDCVIPCGLCKGWLNLRYVLTPPVLLHSCTSHMVPDSVEWAAFWASCGNTSVCRAEQQGKSAATHTNPQLDSKISLFFLYKREHISDFSRVFFFDQREGKEKFTPRAVLWGAQSQVSVFTLLMVASLGMFQSDWCLPLLHGV